MPAQLFVIPKKEKPEPAPGAEECSSILKETVAMYGDKLKHILVIGTTTGGVTFFRSDLENHSDKVYLMEKMKNLLLNNDIAPEPDKPRGA